jgi:hypothetical protein
MLDRRIRKFEIGKHQIFTITFERENASTGTYDTYQIKCAEYPRPELIEAVKELSPHITELLELPDYCEDRLIAKKLTYTYNEKTAETGVTITAKFYIPDAGTFIEVKAPKRVINHGTPTSEIPFTLECSKIIERLTTEIFRYIDGDRAQDKLNFDDREEN